MSYARFEVGMYQVDLITLPNQLASFEELPDGYFTMFHDVTAETKTIFYQVNYQKETDTRRYDYAALESRLFDRLADCVGKVLTLQGYTFSHQGNTDIASTIKAIMQRVAPEVMEHHQRRELAKRGFLVRTHMSREKIWHNGSSDERICIYVALPKGFRFETRDPDRPSLKIEVNGSFKFLEMTHHFTLTAPDHIKYKLNLFDMTAPDVLRELVEKRLRFCYGFLTEIAFTDFVINPIAV